MEKFISLRWSKILEILFISVIGVRVLSKIDVITNKQSIYLIFLFLFMVGAKFCIEIFVNVKKRRHDTKTEILTYFPAEIVSFFVFQGVLIKNSIQWILRQEYMPIELAGKKISYMKKSQYQTAFIIFLVMSAAEIPFGVLLMHFMIRDESQRILIHFAIIVLTIYSFSLILGDRRKIVHGAHFLSEKILHLRIADRFSIDIAIDSILEVRLFNEDIYKWRKANNITNESFLQVAPCIYTDKPNILISIKKSQDTIIHRFEQRSDIQHILVFVDDPAVLKNDILDLMQKSAEVNLEQKN